VTVHVQLLLFYSSFPLSFTTSWSAVFAGLKVINKTRPITWLRALSLLRQTPTPSGHGDKTLMRGSEDRLATDSTDRFPVAYKDWRSIRLVTSVLITSFSPSGVGFVGVGRDARLFPQGVRAEVVYSYKRIRPAYHSIK
jgi:hypothetical protein